MNVELSILILTYNETDNLKVLIPGIRKVVEQLSVEYEILIMDGKSSDQTVEVARSLGCRVCIQKESGYGNAFREAFREARGEYVINIDADCSHDPRFMINLWQKRKGNQMVIASRYIKGGEAHMSIMRNVLSIILNRVYAFVLSLPYKDLSSGFRLYETSYVKNLVNDMTAKDFDVLLEILIRFCCEGYNIAETPFSYQPRSSGNSSAKIMKFGISYIKTLYKSWRLRTSASSAIIS